QIDQGPRDRVTIHRYRRQVCVNVFLKRETLLFDLITVGLERVTNQLRDVGVAKLVFLSPGFDSRKIQDVVNQRGQALALFTNDAVVLLLFVPGCDAAQLECLGVQANQSERCAQLMRYVGNEVGLQTGEGKFLVHDVSGEYQPADDHQRKKAEDQKTAMHPGLTKRLYAGALILDAEGQPAENVVEFARHFRFPFAPAGRRGERLEVVPHFHVRGIDHHRQRITSLVCHLLSNLLLKHSREKSVLKITRVESDATQHHVVL